VTKRILFIIVVCLDGLVLYGIFDLLSDSLFASDVGILVFAAGLLLSVGLYKYTASFGGQERRMRRSSLTTLS
jgi:hypothetical protein